MSESKMKPRLRADELHDWDNINAERYICKIRKFETLSCVSTKKFSF